MFGNYNDYCYDTLTLSAQDFIDVSVGLEKYNN